MRKTILAAVAAVALISPALAQDMTAAQHAKRAEQLTEDAVQYLGRAIGLYDTCVGDPLELRMTTKDMIHEIYKPETAGRFVDQLDRVIARKAAEDIDCSRGQAIKAQYERYYTKGNDRVSDALRHAEKANNLAER